jgi:hypothetical protein
MIIPLSEIIEVKQCKGTDHKELAIEAESDRSEDKNKHAVNNMPSNAA